MPCVDMNDSMDNQAIHLFDDLLLLMLKEMDSLELLLLRIRIRIRML